MFLLEHAQKICLGQGVLHAMLHHLRAGFSLTLGQGFIHA